MINSLRKIATLCLTLVITEWATAQPLENRIPWAIPDTAKVVSVFQLFQVPASQPVSGFGLESNRISLYYGYGHKWQSASLKVPDGGRFPEAARGLNSRFYNKQHLFQKFRITPQDTIGVFLTCARDSASRKQLFSGYLYYPQLKKWKLVGTWEKEGVGEYYQGLLSALPISQTGNGFSTIGSWYQLNTGAWKEQSTTGKPVPQQMPFSNIDSLEQAKKESKRIRKLLGTATIQQKEGVYYEILQPGTGKEVKLTDTVTVFYKGYLLEDGTIFDQTDKEPRTFPLTRLIKGWQIGVPLLKTGGKIKLIIPSGIGYGIRTRAAKIPPNSILVFEIEVVKTQ